MTIWRLVFKEILHRKLSFALGLLSVVAAVTCAVGATSLLAAHDARTAALLARKEAELKSQMAELEDDMRKAMLKLGFNLVILPKNQDVGDWYADGFATEYMPEDYVHRLAESDIVTIRHLLPSLQQKMTWPEMRRTIILMGVEAEVPKLNKSPRTPLVQPVPRGAMVLGYELSQGLGLEPGQKVRLMGREFTVQRCHAERGTKDDITVWINLREAQEMLDKEGLVNAILALQCICAGPAGLASLRSDVAGVLPDTRVIERGSKILARAEARAKVGEKAKAALERERKARAALRRERERVAAFLAPLVIAACALWVGLLAFGNARARRGEVGILRALGLRGRQIMLLFLSRAFAMGLVGGAVGYAAGLFLGARLEESLEGAAGAVALASLLRPGVLPAALLGAPLLACLASWIPALLAAQQDPARTLMEQ